MGRPKAIRHKCAILGCDAKARVRCLCGMHAARERQGKPMLDRKWYDIYGLRKLLVGQSITVQSKNNSLYSYLNNRGDVLDMTFKGTKLGGQRWQVTRVE